MSESLSGTSNAASDQQDQRNGIFQPAAGTHGRKSRKSRSYSSSSSTDRGYGRREGHGYNGLTSRERSTMISGDIQNINIRGKPSPAQAIHIYCRHAYVHSSLIFFIRTELPRRCHIIVLEKSYRGPLICRSVAQQSVLSWKRRRFK